MNAAELGQHLKKLPSSTTTASEHSYFALYEAYGTRPYEWGSDPDRQKANTKEEEKDLGLLNEGMRYRDLDTGTFLTRDPIGYADGPNVYCYVHCNPITKFDPLGLAVNLEAYPVIEIITSGYGGYGYMAGVYAEPVKTEINHTKITIIPENQDAYRDDPRFKDNVLPDGRVYTTLGAGSDGGAGPFFSDLKSDVQRPTDLNRDSNVFSTSVNLPDGMTEDQYIQLLFETDANYQDDTTYELFPNKWSNDHNSNSYTSGLLDATGGTVDQKPQNAPGYNKPLPKEKFSKPSQEPAGLSESASEESTSSSEELISATEDS